MSPRVGFLAPYAYCEASSWAMPLAELASVSGCTVLWFHPQGWSRHGIGQFSEQVISQEHGSEHWQTLDCAIAVGVPHQPILKIPQAQVWTPSVPIQHPGIKNFSRLCFPCRSYAKQFRQSRTRTYKLCEWSFGEPDRPEGKPEFIMVADPHSIEYSGPGVLYILRRFQQETGVWPTLVSWRAWPKIQYNTLRAWCDEGLNWVRDPTWSERRILLSNCKGLIDCSLAPAHGWSLQAAEWGVPVVAYDVEPATDWLRHDVNARLAACELASAGQHTWAVPDVAALWSEILKWLTRLEDLAGSIGPTFLQRREFFHDFWTEWWHGPVAAS